MWFYLFVFVSIIIDRFCECNISSRHIQVYLRKTREDYVMRWIMRSYHQKLVGTLLTTPNFHQDLLSKPSSLSRTSLKACLKIQINQNPSLIHHVVQWILKSRIKEKNPVNKSYFMQEGLILRMRMRNWEQICRVCNAGLWNWKKYARKCKTKCLRCWNQNYHGRIMQDPCQGCVDKDPRQCAYIAPLFPCILMYIAGTFGVFVIIALIFYFLCVAFFLVISRSHFWVICLIVMRFW